MTDFVKFNRDTVHRVRVGDTVLCDPAWNSTTSERRRQLPERARVVGIIPGAADLGVLFQVQSITGQRMRLSAVWFGPLES